MALSPTQKTAAYRLKNLEKIQAYQEKYRTLNKVALYQKMRLYREKNSGVIKAQRAGKRLANIDAERLRIRQYNEKNKELIAARRRCQRHRDVVNARRRHLLSTCPKTILTYRLRARLSKAVRKDAYSKSTADLLGCSWEFLVAHIEKQFTPGMSWEERQKWHLDHIKPLKAFDLTDPDQLAQACHYTNLQPLWALDNLKKGAKYTPPHRNTLKGTT